MQLCSFFSCLQVTVGFTNVRCCVGFAGWHLQRIFVKPLLSILTIFPKIATTFLDLFLCFLYLRLRIFQICHFF